MWTNLFRPPTSVVRQAARGENVSRASFRSTGPGAFRRFDRGLVRDVGARQHGHAGVHIAHIFMRGVDLFEHILYEPRELGNALLRLGYGLLRGGDRLLGSKGFQVFLCG